MWVGNNFTYVCLSVYPCVCESVQSVTFELLKLGTSFPVYIYTYAISRSRLSAKVIASRPRSNKYGMHSTEKYSCWRSAFAFLFYKNSNSITKKLRRQRDLIVPN